MQRRPLGAAYGHLGVHVVVVAESRAEERDPFVAADDGVAGVRAVPRSAGERLELQGAATARCLGGL